MIQLQEIIAIRKIIRISNTPYAHRLFGYPRQQVGTFDKEGNYLLEFDYNQDPELVMDILKYGAGVEVLAPTGLRKRVKDELTKALKNY